MSMSEDVQIAKQNAIAALQSIVLAVLPQLERIEEKLNQPKPANPSPGKQQTVEEGLETIKHLWVYAIRGRRIETIRQIRSLTGCGLYEAKQLTEWMIDHLENRNNHPEDDTSADD